MKPFKSLSLLTAAVLALLFSLPASAQLIAYDDAGNYRVTANWTNGVLSNVSGSGIITFAWTDGSSTTLNVTTV